MISRRKFLASAVAVAVAPSVAPELVESFQPVVRALRADPLGQRGYIGASFWNAAMVQNESWMVLAPEDVLAEIAIMPPTPRFEVIPPSFDPRVLYHFDQPNGRCPDELNCGFCLAMKVSV